ncbi:mitochondrial protein import receptor [Pseudozyma hubeiensis SY62]|uniref:Mitochondrial protein import receptor n=1 Tax=Pseudozyma hubeiensis (strain SY62) TaxID=1305764 RepID=R9P1I8_PSEHS|nr:mitochondrial protein import receptor [Pseudozyma hubeiensis SY62]GAC94992.1 mitochondrial protein import receptor [Pseudozyma hubeiensis SY62]
MDFRTFITDRSDESTPRNHRPQARHESSARHSEGRFPQWPTHMALLTAFRQKPLPTLFANIADPRQQCVKLREEASEAAAFVPLSFCLQYLVSQHPLSLSPQLSVINPRSIDGCTAHYRCNCSL